MYIIIIIKQRVGLKNVENVLQVPNPSLICIYVQSVLIMQRIWTFCFDNEILMACPFWVNLHLTKEEHETLGL